MFGSGSVHLDVSYRMDLNRVQLGVAGHHLALAERALIARAKARYGNLVQVIAQPAGRATGTSLDCTDKPGEQYCYAPLRGGIEIFRINSQGQLQPGYCTGGFIASSRTDGKLYQFTAGHCAVEDGTGTWWTAWPNGTKHAIGTVHDYSLGYQQRGTEAILNINNPTGWYLPQGWVSVLENPNNTTLNDENPHLQRSVQHPGRASLRDRRSLRHGLRHGSRSRGALVLWQPRTTLYMGI